MEKKIFNIINKSNNYTSLDHFIINSVLKTDKMKIKQQKKLLNELNYLNNNNYLACENIFNYIEKKISS